MLLWPVNHKLQQNLLNPFLNTSEAIAGNTISLNAYIYNIAVEWAYQLPYMGNFSRREILAKMTLNFHWVLFSLFQGLSMKTYSRVYFSLCLFLANSGRSRTQRKIKSHTKNSRYMVTGREIYTSFKAFFLIPTNVKYNEQINAFSLSWHDSN